MASLRAAAVAAILIASMAGCRGGGSQAELGGCSYTVFMYSDDFCGDSGLVHMGERVDPSTYDIDTLTCNAMNNALEGFGYPADDCISDVNDIANSIGLLDHVRARRSAADSMIYAIFEHVVTFYKPTSFIMSCSCTGDSESEGGNLTFDHTERITVSDDIENQAGFAASRIKGSDTFSKIELFDSGCDDGNPDNVVSSDVYDLNKVHLDLTCSAAEKVWQACMYDDKMKFNQCPTTVAVEVVSSDESEEADAACANAAVDTTWQTHLVGGTAVKEEVEITAVDFVDLPRRAGVRRGRRGVVATLDMLGSVPLVKCTEVAAQSVLEFKKCDSIVAASAPIGAPALSAVALDMPCEDAEAVLDYCSDWNGNHCENARFQSIGSPRGDAACFELGASGGEVMRKRRGVPEQKYSAEKLCDTCNRVFDASKHASGHASAEEGMHVELTCRKAAAAGSSSGSSGSGSGISDVALGLLITGGAVVLVGGVAGVVWWCRRGDAQGVDVAAMQLL